MNGSHISILLICLSVFINMKLPCQVELLNRNLINLNIRISHKYVQATLALGKEPKSENEFFILYFSTTNKGGTKYRLKRNLKQVFTRCINEGKSTLSFEDPPHDLYIKSEAIQLKCFMRLLKSCLSGDANALQLSSLSSLSVTAVENAPTKLVIQDRSQFPKKGLPRTLKSLFINGIKMCNFRREILLLKHLTVLDLSNNEIERLPVEFGRMPSLNELHLGNNEIGKIGHVDWRWLLGPEITKTLKLLDLSNNKLKSLPNAIWKLQNLFTLKLDENNLQRLPHTISRIKTLRYLKISKNNLESLPGGLLNCTLEYFDLSGNKFHCNTRQSAAIDMNAWNYNAGTLVHLASEVVLKYKLYYASNMIPYTLVEFLDNVNVCVCGRLAIDENLYFKKLYNMEDYKVVIFDDNNTNNVVGFDCYYCSIACMRRKSKFWEIR